MIYENNCRSDSNYILEILKRIDTIQKNVILNDETCLGCEALLLRSGFNTVPLTLLLDCCEPLTSFVDFTTTTTFYRVESIINNQYLRLRLLTSTTTEPITLVGTNRTIIVDIKNIIAIECFEPITVEPCNTTT